MDVYFGLKPKLSTQRFKSTKEWKKGLLVKVWNFKQAAQLVPSSKKKKPSAIIVMSFKAGADPFNSHRLTHSFASSLPCFLI